MIPKYKYSREELIQLQNCENSNVKPEGLCSAHESFDGYWDPGLCLTRQYFPTAAIPDGTSFKESSSVTHAMSRKLSKTSGGHRSDDDDDFVGTDHKIILGPHRRRFEIGGQVIVNSALKNSSPTRQAVSKRQQYEGCKENWNINNERLKNSESRSVNCSPQHLRKFWRQGCDGGRESWQRRGCHDTGKGYDSDSREQEKGTGVKGGQLVRKNSLQDMPTSKDDRGSPQENPFKNRAHCSSPKANYGFRRWNRHGSPRDRCTWQGSGQNRSDSMRQRHYSPSNGGNSWHRSSPTGDRHSDSSENTSWRNRNSPHGCSLKQNDGYQTKERDDRRYIWEAGKFRRGEARFYRDQPETEPEWTSGGPSSRYDTVELQGFNSTDLVPDSVLTRARDPASVAEIVICTDRHHISGKCDQLNDNQMGDANYRSVTTIIADDTANARADVVATSCIAPPSISNVSVNKNICKSLLEGSQTFEDQISTGQQAKELNKSPVLKADNMPNVFSFDDIFTFDNIPDFSDTLETATDLGGSRFQQWFVPASRAADASAEVPNYTNTNSGNRRDTQNSVLDDFRYLDDIMKSLLTPAPVLNQPISEELPGAAATAADCANLMELLHKAQLSSYESSPARDISANLPPITTIDPANVYLSKGTQSLKYEMTPQDIEKSLKAILCSPPTIGSTESSVNSSAFPASSRGKVHLAADVEADLLSSNLSDKNTRHVNRFNLPNSYTEKEYCRTAGKPVAGDSIQPASVGAFNAGCTISLSHRPSTGYDGPSGYQKQQQQFNSVDFDNLATINRLMTHVSQDVNKPRDALCIGGLSMGNLEENQLQSAENSQKEFIQNYVLQQQLLKMTPGSSWSDFLNPVDSIVDQKMSLWPLASTTAPDVTESTGFDYTQSVDRTFVPPSTSVVDQLKVSLSLQHQLLLQQQQQQQQQVQQQAQQQQQVQQQAQIVQQQQVQQQKAQHMQQQIQQQLQQEQVRQELQQQQHLMTLLSQQKAAIDQQQQQQHQQQQIKEAAFKHLEQQHHQQQLHNAIMQQQELARQVAMRDKQFGYQPNNSNLLSTGYTRPTQLLSSTGPGGHSFTSRYQHLPPSPRSLHVPFSTPPSGPSISPLPPSPRSLPPHLGCAARYGLSASSPIPPTHVILQAPPLTGSPLSRRSNRPPHVTIQPPISGGSNLHLGLPPTHSSLCSPLLLSPPRSPLPPSSRQPGLRNRPPQLVLQPPQTPAPQQQQLSPYAGNLPPGSPRPLSIRSPSPCLSLLQPPSSPHTGSTPSPIMFGCHAPLNVPQPHNASPLLSPNIIPTPQRSGGSSPSTKRIPSPQELSGLAQSILQNALIKKQLEEQKERFVRKQMERAKCSSGQTVAVAGGFPNSCRGPLSNIPMMCHSTCTAADTCGTATISAVNSLSAYRPTGPSADKTAGITIAGSAVKQLSTSSGNSSSSGAGVPGSCCIAAASAAVYITLPGAVSNSVSDGQKASG